MLKVSCTLFAAKKRLGSTSIAAMIIGTYILWTVAFMSMTGNMAPKKSKKRADPKDKPDKRRRVVAKSSGRATWKGAEVSSGEEEEAASKTLGSCHVFLIVMFWHQDSFIELLSKYKRHFASVLCK